MGILRKAAAWGVVAFAALVVVFFARPMYRQGEPTVAGRTAQDFPTEIGGKPGRLSDLRGKVVVLNFWATWCPPCVEETHGGHQVAQKFSTTTLPLKSLRRPGLPPISVGKSCAVLPATVGSPCRYIGRAKNTTTSAAN